MIFEEEVKLPHGEKIKPILNPGLEVPDPISPPPRQVNMYGWNIWRIFRERGDSHNNIIRIELRKDNIIRSFVFDGEKVVDE